MNAEAAERSNLAQSPSLEKALNEAIAELEGTIPANPASSKNTKLSNPLEKALKKYFATIGSLIPYNDLVNLYTRHAKQDGK